MAFLREELEQVYDENKDQFFACALAVTSCGGLAEDAIHNAFCRALKLTKKPDNLVAYMLRSVRNAAIDLVRREKRTVLVDAEMLFEIAAESDDALENREILTQLGNALQLLSEDERETVIQHLIGDLTFQKIATMRNRPMGTVTSWYRRGVKKLQEHLKSEFRS